MQHLAPPLIMALANFPVENGKPQHKGSIKFSTTTAPLRIDLRTT